MTAEVELADWERELLESAAPSDERQCQRCSKFRPLRRWPLGDRPMLCHPCYLYRVRGGEPDVQLLCGELVVFTDHPQRGQTLRGAIRAVGIEDRVLRPVVRWRITGPRQDDALGEHVGDFADAESRLLAATSWGDEISPEATEAGRAGPSAGTA